MIDWLHAHPLEVIVAAGALLGLARGAWEIWR